MAKLNNEKLISELMDMYGWSREETINGYGYFEDEFGAVEICRIDDLHWCGEFDYGIDTDEDACMQAEKDGVKFINDIEGIDKRRYIDTPKNRMLCEEYVRTCLDN
jgi:hypothetical protein